MNCSVKSSPYKLGWVIFCMVIRNQINIRGMHNILNLGQIFTRGK